MTYLGNVPRGLDCRSLWPCVFLRVRAGYAQFLPNLLNLSTVGWIYPVPTWQASQGIHKGLVELSFLVSLPFNSSVHFILIGLYFTWQNFCAGWFLKLAPNWSTNGNIFFNVVLQIFCCLLSSNDISQIVQSQFVESLTLMSGMLCKCGW